MNEQITIPADGIWILNRLQEQGYDGFLVLGESEEPKWFE